ncbi:MAG: hypothetical protein ACE5LL_03685 [Alphaproteobacteria bacterium]
MDVVEEFYRSRVRRARVGDATVRDATLPVIPLVDVGEGGPVALFAAERARAEELLAAGRRFYGGVNIVLSEALTRAWLRHSDNPYRKELEAIAAQIPGPGPLVLNLSYEWFCTTAVAPDPEGSGNRLLRTLDWPLDGLGRHLVVARQEGPAGTYFNVTWPGFVGVATAMAPGRFSAALNQAPMRRLGLPVLADWVSNRLSVWRSRGLPPVHLLREVFDHSRTYVEAKARLAEARLCLPALFILSGVKAEEGCVIERLEDRAVVHDSPFCITNHWLTPGLSGPPRTLDSHDRRALMEGLYRTVADGFGWLVPPVLNACTRVAALANAGAPKLLVQGFEEDGPATAVFRV